MTKFLVSSIGWIYLVIVLDWYTKKIVGWNISLTSFMRDMATLGIEHSPSQVMTIQKAMQKQNRGVSRVMRTAKEIIWLNEFASFEEAKEKIGRWIQEDYNKLYGHSQPGYMSPFVAKVTVEEFGAKLTVTSPPKEERIRKAA
jgi:putative transposase